MLTELLMQDERRAGREEGRKEGRIAGRRESVLEFVSELGVVSNELQEKINQETDLEQLKNWAKLAVRSESLEQFIANM